MSADLDTLAALQIGHLKSIPFENLDITRNVPIKLEIQDVFDKIVGGNRGGFCYELNSAFGALLEAIGFDVTLLSARVATGHGDYGPEFDHLLLLVNMVDSAYLVDVGFGDSFTIPLRLQSGIEQEDHGNLYMALKLDTESALMRRRTSIWEIVLMFSLEPRALGDFQERCLWTQTSPDSHFNRQAICILLTDGGRKTLRGTHMFIRVGEAKTEWAIANEGDWRACLAEQFGIVLKPS